MNKLRFIFGNSKLIHGQAILNLPAGFSCPFALTCLTFANRRTGKLKNGEHQKVRCYAASEEAVFPAARKLGWHNYSLLLQCNGNEEKLYQLIQGSLPNRKLIRPHSRGDFFSQEYFNAWMRVARANPIKIFYAYTKALSFWLKAREGGLIPENFRLVASYGGTHDHLIAREGLRYAKIVSSEEEAKSLGLPIDTDDSHAFLGQESFALLIHGNGPKGSLQAQLHNRLVQTSRKNNKLKP